jgi:hypothetical protein
MGLRQRSGAGAANRHHRPRRRRRRHRYQQPRPTMAARGARAREAPGRTALRPRTPRNAGYPTTRPMEPTETEDEGGSGQGRREDTSLLAAKGVTQQRP